VTSVVRNRPVSAEDAEVLASIAEDYYVNGENQDAIASRHRISRSYVSRLLRRARELGIVEISVHRDIRRDAALEVGLRERYGLARCIVVASDATSPQVVLRRAGQVAAGLLGEVITPDSTIGLSWGNGVRAVVEALRPRRLRARHVVQMFGGLSTAPAELMSGELVADAARDLGASHDRLHAPWIVESADLARSLLEQQDVAAVLGRAAAADVAVVGIGATGRGSSALLFNQTYLTPRELAEIEEQGAVGDICGRIYDAGGRPCRASVMDRVIGLDLETIGRLPLVIGIATGHQKYRAVRSALRGRLVGAMVTDSEIAREVLADERD
jgi:DNA-binding transcriptional regulator LsrR (DeoR family)